jgi:hypothetical protein
MTEDRRAEIEANVRMALAELAKDRPKEPVEPEQLPAGGKTSC